MSLPETRPSLLVRLRDREDDRAWDTFSKSYESAIRSIAAAQGLQHADALDVAQNVMMKLQHAIENYDPRDGAGSFRAWLGTITRNAATDYRRRNARHFGRGDVSASQAGGKAVNDSDPMRRCSWPEQQTSPDKGPWSDEAIERAYLKAVFERVEHQVRSEFSAEAWVAFDATFLGSESVEQVARRLGKTVGAVYASRARVLRRFRELAQRWELHDGDLT